MIDFTALYVIFQPLFAIFDKIVDFALKKPDFAGFPHKSLQFTSYPWSQIRRSRAQSR